MRIDRCICADRCFADLLDEARNGGWSLKQLVEQTGASAGCSMCGPYLRRAYRTGQSSFNDLLGQDDEPYATSEDKAPAPVQPPC